MAGEAGKNGADKSTGKSSIGFSLPFAERAPANPIEMMAAATAAGMALTSQFASAFFGMMQAAMDATGKPATSAAPASAQARPVDAPMAAKVDTQPASVTAPAEAAVAKPVPAKPVAATKTRSSAKPVKREKALVAKPVTALTAKTDTVALAPVDTAAEKSKATKGKGAKASGAKAKAVTAKPVRPAAPPPAQTAVEPPVAVAAEPAKSKPAARKTTKAADDLKKISGVGPKLAEMLKDLGVTRYADIAAWTAKDIEHFDLELGLDGRIAKDDWIAQAKALQR